MPTGSIYRARCIRHDRHRSWKSAGASLLFFPLGHSSAGRHPSSSIPPCADPSRIPRVSTVILPRSFSIPDSSSPGLSRVFCGQVFPCPLNAPGNCSESRGGNLSRDIANKYLSPVRSKRIVHLFYSCSIRELQFDIEILARFNRASFTDCR